MLVQMGIYTLMRQLLITRGQELRVSVKQVTMEQMVGQLDVALVQIVYMFMQMRQVEHLMISLIQELVELMLVQH